MAPQKSTYVYKTVGTLEIKADVYLPSDSTKKGLAVLVWFHGGGLLSGSRDYAAPHLIAATDKYDVCVVSPDYRLAPQVPLPVILEDVCDSIKWATETLPTMVTPGMLDPSKLVVSGSSAGGYIALLAGLPISGVTPKPKVLLPIYPITNPLGPFFTTPQRPVSYVKDGRIISDEEMAKHVDPNSEVLSEYSTKVPKEEQRPDDRAHFYTYMVQEANLAHLLFVKAPEVKVDDYIIAKNVTKDFPPTYIIHGDPDGAVGIEQSRSVAEALEKAGATFVFEERPGQDHGFDSDPKETLDKLYAYMKEHLD